jgi:GAF domain-containing protein
VSHRYDGVIAEAMAELATTCGGHASIEKTLYELTSAAVQFISGVDCADVLLIKGGEFRSLAATSPTAAELDDVQLSTAEGPCLDAAERDVIVRSNDLRSETRWPKFAPQAVRAGVLSVMSFRLYTEGRDSGALNLLGFEPGSFAAEPEALGAMLATHAAVSLTAANRQHQFESALASRDVIGQAKGIIMERFDVDAIRAFELLRRISQESNTPVSKIAARLTKRGMDDASSSSDV